MTDFNIKEIEEKLKTPFKPDEIEWRVSATNKEKTKGLAVAYITNRAIQKRLDEVVGIFNWQNKFEIVGNAKVCGISIFINEKWVTKYDGASDTDIEAVKGGLSGAMKRAAVQWGIGRYLYNLPGQWVKIKQQGKSYAIDDTPILPDWALPEGYKEKTPKNNWKKPQASKNKLPDNIQDCLTAFKKIGIKQADIENYLHLEIEMLEEKDIETLRSVYQAIVSGKKQKDDFFYYLEENKRSKQTLDLENELGG